MQNVIRGGDASRPSRRRHSQPAARHLRALLVWGLLASSPVLAEPPGELRPWLEARQLWERDTEGPIVELGAAGQFDDTHVFAPAVARSDGRYLLWYCGSRGDVLHRVFQLGLAESADGRVFRKSPQNPVYAFGDGRRSVLTPALLRTADGSLLRENGRIRMWFSSTWFEDESGRHTLHETSSVDGVHWEAPSEPQLEGAYAPTIVRTGPEYQMWYADVTGRPWVIRRATSRDGRKWRVDAEPALVLDQPWERLRLFYPHVLHVDGAYLLWYGSYWSEGREELKTALGFAASVDGKTWYKHGANPVFPPDARRPWESHFVTSHSVLRNPRDGSFRMWYASRKKPPFVNKYFALNTAVWRRPPATAGSP